MSHSNSNTDNYVFGLVGDKLLAGYGYMGNRLMQIIRLKQYNLKEVLKCLLIIKRWGNYTKPKSKFTKFKVRIQLYSGTVKIQDNGRTLEEDLNRHIKIISLIFYENKD
ncbi:hypothetical protein BD560DRAFT_427176 [Blakeslea trispora]|nr:hypothetical protein BD560DRAFT_427176 [Blakeslea trispora]